jgi:hypothetical protein
MMHEIFYPLQLCIRVEMAFGFVEDKMVDPLFSHGIAISSASPYFLCMLYVA